MRILKGLLAIVGVLALILGVWAFFLTRDGDVVTPEGEGTVAIGDASFEAFPLPDYVASVLPAETKSYLVEVESGIKVHMLEVGEGYPVYMQHGNPTNALLYRKVAAELPADQFRMIMPSMVGLGFSSKVPASQHTLDNHIRWMKAALDQVGAEELIYVGQDWGGPVGMGVLARSPGKLKGAVVMNTGFMAPTEERALSSAHAMANRPLVGEAVIEGFGGIWGSLPDVQGDPATMPDDVVALYESPIKDSGNGKAPLALMRMVPTGPNHPSVEQMREIQNYVATLDIPAILVWGMQDPILAQGLEPMKAQFPDAAVIETDAGHFLQEEVPIEIAAAVTAVYAQIEGAGGELAAEAE